MNHNLGRGLPSISLLSISKKIVLTSLQKHTRLPLSLWRSGYRISPNTTPFASVLLLTSLSFTMKFSIVPSVHAILPSRRLMTLLLNLTHCQTRATRIRLWLCNYPTTTRHYGLWICKTLVSKLWALHTYNWFICHSGRTFGCQRWAWGSTRERVNLACSFSGFRSRLHHPLHITTSSRHPSLSLTFIFMRSPLYILIFYP
jgi:hypothetical protein